MNTNDVILRDLDAEELKQRRPFAHFGWEGTGAFSFYVISDGYWNSAKVIIQVMKSNPNDFATVDSLVYPMFFNYRHSVETFLKQIFFNLNDGNDQEKIDFLNQGHDLRSLWGTLRPLLNKGKKHLGASVNLDAIEHYIAEINNFDPDSMVMRYPVSKDLTGNKGKAYHFDYVTFGDRMDELCNALRQLDYELSNPMTAQASLDELNDYLSRVEKYRPQIEQFLEIVRVEAAKEAAEGMQFKKLSDLEDLLEPTEVFKYLENCEPDLLMLLDNLYYGGRTVGEKCVRLSKSAVERQKEFVKVCNELLDMDGLKFGTPAENWQINIFGKQASALLLHISKALAILDLEDQA